jgi:hypothetical protein
MGSQSVTNFSAAKKKRIQLGLRAYQPDSPEARQQALFAGAAAVGGPFTKTNPIVQALGSASVESGQVLLLSLAGALKEARRPEQITEILQAFQVSPDHPRPVGALAAGLRTRLEETLTSTQQKGDSAPAAEDAITQTLLDAVELAGRPERAAAEVSAEELVQALCRLPEWKLAGLYLTNTTTSLIGSRLAAARGEETPPEIVASLKDAIRDTYVGPIIQLVLATAKKREREAARAPAALAEPAAKKRPPPGPPSVVAEIEPLRSVATDKEKRAAVLRFAPSDPTALKGMNERQARGAASGARHVPVGVRHEAEDFVIKGLGRHGAPGANGNRPKRRDGVRDGDAR